VVVVSVSQSRSISDDSVKEEIEALKAKLKILVTKQKINA
jgi:hypothetical protein